MEIPFLLAEAPNACCRVHNMEPASENIQNLFYELLSSVSGLRIISTEKLHSKTTPSQAQIGCFWLHIFWPVACGRWPVDSGRWLVTGSRWMTAGLLAAGRWPLSVVYWLRSAGLLRSADVCRPSGGRLRCVVFWLQSASCGVRRFVSRPNAPKNVVAQAPHPSLLMLRM